MKFLHLFRLASLLSLFMMIMGCQDLADELVGEKPTDAKTINITMVAKSSTNPVFRSARIGAEAAAADLSDKYSKIDVKIDWRTPKVESAQEQALRIHNAVLDGTDAIIVSCSDDSILTGAINAAVEKGIPVMTFDSDAPGSKRFAFYGPDDVQIGKDVINELASVIGETGEVAILGGSENAPNLKKRVQGLKEAAEKFPGIKLVGTFYHLENAESAVATMMKVHEAHPNLKAWAMVGGWPFFNETLQSKIESGKYKIVAVDALPVQLPYIENGLVDVFLGQPTFKWGDVAVRTIIEKIYLKEEVKEINHMKLIRVWKDNLGGWSRQLRAWGYEGVPEKYLGL